jgi:hypothetical protein
MKLDTTTIDVDLLRRLCPGDREVRLVHKDEHCQFCGGLGNSPVVDPATEKESP